MGEPHSPLEPVASATRILLLLLGLLLAVGTATSLFGSGSLFGWGRHVNDVCADANNIGVGVEFGRTRPGVTAAAEGLRLCRSGADISQRVLSTLTQLPSFLVFAGALVLLYRLVRGAERDGTHTPSTARRLRGLGWFLVAASLAATAVEGVARRLLVATLLRGDVVSGLGLAYWDMPWILLLVGLGVLSFARITRGSAQMREDLEGTV